MASHFKHLGKSEKTIFGHVMWIKLGFCKHEMNLDLITKSSSLFVCGHGRTSAYISLCHKVFITVLVYYYKTSSPRYKAIQAVM